MVLLLNRSGTGLLFSETTEEVNKQQSYSCSLTYESQSTVEHHQCVIINHNDSFSTKNMAVTNFNSGNARMDYSLSSCELTTSNETNNEKNTCISSNGTKNEHYINYLNYV